MANRKPMEPNSLVGKVKVLEKLFSSGCKTEKDLQSLTMEKILVIPDITVPDMTVIMKLQQHTKSHTLFSFLGGGEHEQQELGD